jgi:phospholipid/cholesterol/gamma-HCH transport system substrate-binding protein
VKRLLLGLCGALALSGCQFTGLEGVTLPGGVAGRGPANVYTVYFRDVLDLVPQSGVRQNDVLVGTVKSIDLVGGKAKVVVRVRKGTRIPANAQGQLRQTALLGEKYVGLDVPPGVAPSQRLLADGAVIETDQTTQETQLEDVFGALSALLNGGGVEQLQTISIELAQALAGRESKVRDLLSQLDGLTGSLDTHRSEVTHALDSLDRLASTLVVQRQTIATALRDIAPGLKVLADERSDLVKLLVGLDRLSVVAKRVINRTTTQTVQDLRLLQPTLDRLTQSGDKIASSLQLLLSYPFGDAVFNAVPGDYTGLKVTLNVDLRPNSPDNPLGPNGPFCGTPPVSVPGSLPKPAFCTSSTAAAGLAAKAPHPTVVRPPVPGTTPAGPVPRSLPVAPLDPRAGGLGRLLRAVFQ